MMMGTVPTSVPQFILLGNWILEGKFKLKWDRLKSNRLFWVLSSVFILHVLGLFYTENLSDGIKDVKTKLPLVFLPVIFFSSNPISKKEFHSLLYFFIAGSVVNTLWCMSYSFILHQNEIVRKASRFMSHIRLGLYLDMAIASCVYFIFESKKLNSKILFSLVILYFVFTLYALGLATGILNLLILVVFAVLYVIFNQQSIYKIIALVVLVTIVGLVTSYILKIKEAQLTVKNHENNSPKRESVNGRPYFHLEESKQVENGFYVHMNIQPQELQKEWNVVCPEDSFNFSTQTNLIRYEVLLRYLASKGFTKDSLALHQLNSEDLQRIKKNISNCEITKWSFLHKRIYEFVNEYDDFKNNRYINGHSITMRLYFWKAAMLLINEHPMFGVGTGDVQQELNKVYVNSDSPLKTEWYKRPHNQYLTITVATGVFGLLVFLFSLMYPIKKYKKILPVLYWPFIITALGSFFVEDTLETQAGLSFFAVFNTLFVSQAFWKKRMDSDPGELEKTES